VSVPFAGVVPRALVRFGHRHPWAVLAGAIAVMVTGAVLGTRLKFETDVLNLMPRHDPVVSEFRRVLEDFGSLDTMLLVVPVADEDGLESSFQLVDALETELSGSPYLARVDAHIEDPMKLAETVLRHAVLFLDADGLAIWLARMEKAEGEAPRG